MFARSAARSLVILVAIAGGVLSIVSSRAATTGSDTPILEIYADALTTYLPGSATGVQGVRPQVGQRGVNLDGSMRSAPSQLMRIGGNPFENVWSGSQAGGLRLDMGAWGVQDVDIALPTEGFSFTIGRSYNARQETSGSAHMDSDGPQGKNWFQNSQPEIVLYEHASDDDKDVLYLVYGADRFVEFKRVDIASGTSDTFKATNGAAGVVLFAAGATNEPDTYTLIDQHSNEWVFFGFDGDAGAAAGQLWTITDPASNVAYVGDSTTGSTAISNGYNGSGFITTAYDASDRRFSYTYTSGRLTEVKVETKTGGTWASPTGLATVAKVEYDHYGGEAYGDAGDLKMVTITTPLSDTGVDSVRKKYYRYWEGTYNASSNPGYPHALKYIVDFEGTRRQDWEDSTFDEDFLTLSDSSLETYATAYFEYDSSHRVRKAWYNGECGCSGGNNGTYEYTYGTNGSFSDTTTAYDEEWKTRTVEERPDGTFITHYWDEAHQALSRVLTAGDPSSGSPDRWVTAVERNSDGQVTTIKTPATATGYTHSTGATTHSTSAGLVRTFTRESTSTSVTKGFVTATKWQEGTSGTAYYETESGLTSAELASWNSTTLDEEIVRPLMSSAYTYHTAGTTSASGNRREVSYTQSVTSGSLAVSSTGLGFEATSMEEQGVPTDPEKTPYYDADGHKVWEEAENGIITYWEYTDGRLTKLIEDADTGKTGSGEDFENVTIPAGLSSHAAAIHRKTTYTYDAQGRPDTVTAPDGLVSKSYYSKLADGRLVMLSYPRYITSPSTKFYGPVSYTLRNHTSEVEASGTIGLTSNETTSALTAHVDETDSDLITAMDLGTVVRLTTSIYNETGQTLQEQRLYHDVPASGAGSDGTNYDPTLFGYDDMGRRIRTKEAHGTIRRTVYNDLGRVASSWIGTNDSTFAGGESSGTDNMVKTEAVEYDSGADDGNGYVTKRTAYVEDSTTDQRVTTYTNDVRGRTIVEVRPESPHAFHKYDNTGSRVATGFFSSTASIVAGTDDPTTETTNRLGLTEMVYNERGQYWKTIRHKIDDTDGSSDDTLTSTQTHDTVGRVVMERGARFVKTKYDRLGRQTHRYILAKSDDLDHEDTLDVAGDTVLEEHQTVYEDDSDDAVLRVVIMRHRNSTGLGALDNDGDNDALKFTAANVKGRAQFTAYWYDEMGRLEDEVRYGTYGGATFDRDGLSVPTRSDTDLRTSYTYNTAGQQEETTDPRGLVARTEYDDAGRAVKQIRNYDSGVNSGNPSGTDDNQTVAYAYTDGLQVTITADVPTGTDQVTTYTYGTTKGATAGDSKIATGHLLQEVEYPDSASSSDVVTYAYNAQSQEIWKKDQAGNVFETDYDDMGRQSHYRVSTLASGFDGRSRRISRTYTDRGQPELVTQYDNATVGSGSVVDEVKYTYEDWGNVDTFQQDKNSAVGASGSVDDYEVSYTYEDATGGRRTIRRTGITLPSGNAITYDYSNDMDDEASRVSSVKDGTVVLCKYEYLGEASVVSTKYIQASIESLVHDDAVEPDYEALDRFNRVTTSRWGNDLTTPNYFYETDITYDRNSNITLTEDNVHTGFDVEYTMDDLDRLIQAEQGTWGGSSISSGTHDQAWTLDHLGNWDHVTLDLEGDGDFTGTDEYNDDRSHNGVNELTGRDTNDDGTNEDDLVYDAVGNLTDDDADYQYVYDPFGRLRKIKNQSGTLLAEYLYNGLGHMIGRHEDTDDDGDADSSDKWYYSVFDEAWRLVGTYREDDSSPKEDFLNHVAGYDGRGSASYINGVILRDKDANSDWTGAADGTLEERIYYCQSWRGDVVALVDKDSEQVEAVRYTAYGEPFGIPAGDTNSDGDRDGEDAAQLTTWINASAYEVRGDLDLDGDVDASDKAEAVSQGAETLGRAILSGVHSRVGAAGSKRLIDGITCSRHRAYSPTLGRWLTRDPSLYEDGPALYQLLRSNPIASVDPFGLTTIVAGGKGGGGSPSAPKGLYPNADGAVGPDSSHTDPCSEAKAAGLDKDKSGKSVLGRVICRKGAKYTCVWPENRPNGGSIPKKLRDHLDACVRAHEDGHRNMRFTCKGRHLHAFGKEDMGDYPFYRSEVVQWRGSKRCINEFDCEATYGRFDPRRAACQSAQSDADANADDQIDLYHKGMIGAAKKLRRQAQYKK